MVIAPESYGAPPRQESQYGPTLPNQPPQARRRLRTTQMRLLHAFPFPPIELKYYPFSSYWDSSVPKHIGRRERNECVSLDIFSPVYGGALFCICPPIPVF